MPVRTGGSYLLDPATGELTPNPPDHEVGAGDSREGRSGTAREAPSADSGPDDLQSSGGTQSAAPSPFAKADEVDAQRKPKRST